MNTLLKSAYMVDGRLFLEHYGISFLSHFQLPSLILANLASSFNSVGLERSPSGSIGEYFTSIPALILPQLHILIYTN